jgi:hypothetical protein
MVPMMKKTNYHICDKIFSIHYCFHAFQIMWAPPTFSLRASVPCAPELLPQCDTSHMLALSGLVLAKRWVDVPRYLREATVEKH